jgi:hypothetical protein
LSFISSSGGAENTYNFSSGSFSENYMFNYSETSEVLVGSGSDSTFLRLDGGVYAIYLRNGSSISVNNLTLQYGSSSADQYIFYSASPGVNSTTFILNNCVFQKAGGGMIFICSYGFFFFQSPSFSIYLMEELFRFSVCSISYWNLFIFF